MSVICVEPTGINFLVYPSDRPGEVEIFQDVVKALASAFRKRAAGGVDAPQVVKCATEMVF